ncbi:MAG: Nramp family divalent metal transporter [Caulobacterales bacterium]|nr:Nramp family divalent metal transporter [Caulobacterales bacterium]
MKNVLKRLGPGLITGAADDDPSGIATYSQVGARFGYDLLWTMVLSYPLMCAIQLVSARIGRVTGKGLAGTMNDILPRPVVGLLVLLLFVANSINIGADLAAMGAAANLVTGGSSHLFTIGFAVLCIGLQLGVPYHRYATMLKWLTFVLLAYVAVVLVAHVDWAAAGKGLVVPKMEGKDAVVTLVALLGTTISPYLFFWQSSQEVEEIEDRPEAHPLTEAPEQAPEEFARIRLDTLGGMAVSNIIAIAIMISAAATIHASGQQIETAADAARALEPAAGKFAFLLFAVGIIGTGLLAVPVLAGSAAYGFSEWRGWTHGLQNTPWKAKGFYAVIVAATVCGVAVDYSGLDPMKALFWSAVLNGVIAVPIMVAMMVVVSRRDELGEFAAPRSLRILGWAATAVMAAAAIAMFVLQ